MICITDIYKGKINWFIYRINKTMLYSYLDYRENFEELENIRFSLFDTNTNRSQNVGLREVASSYKSVFGVSFFDDYCFFSVMDKDTWNMLDCIDGIESLGRFESPGEFYISLGNTYKDIVKSTTDLVVCKNDTLIVNFRIRKSIRPLDDAMVFWYNSSVNAPSGGHFTIFDLYLSVFLTDGVVVTPETTVYVYVTFYNSVYKLDINQKVVRALTKYKTLNRQV